MIERGFRGNQNVNKVTIIDYLRT